jgi:hypothetical protein
MNFDILNGKTIEEMTSGIYEAVKMLGSEQYIPTKNSNQLGIQIIEKILEEKKKRFLDLTPKEKNTLILELSEFLNKKLPKNTIKGEELLEGLRNEEISKSEKTKNVKYFSFTSQQPFNTIALLGNDLKRIKEAQDIITQFYPNTKVYLQKENENNFEYNYKRLDNYTNVKACLLFFDSSFSFYNKENFWNFNLGFEIGYITSRVGMSNIVLFSEFSNVNNFYMNDIRWIQTSDALWKRTLLTELDVKGFK